MYRRCMYIINHYWLRLINFSSKCIWSNCKYLNTLGKYLIANTNTSGSQTTNTITQNLYLITSTNVVCTRLAATIDLWTSAADHPYLSLTVRFITTNWKLKFYYLDTVPLLSDQNIAETLVVQSYLCANILLGLVPIHQSIQLAYC